MTMQVSNRPHKARRLAIYVLFISCDSVYFMMGRLFYSCQLQDRPAGSLCALRHKLKAIVEGNYFFSLDSGKLKLQVFQRRGKASLLQLFHLIVADIEVGEMTQVVDDPNLQSFELVAA